MFKYLIHKFFKRKATQRSSKFSDSSRRHFGLPQSHVGQGRCKKGSSSVFPVSWMRLHHIPVALVFASKFKQIETS